MTTSTITSDASSVTLSSGGDNYNNPVTVASTVHLGGDNFGLYVQYQWTVHNLGTVDGVLFHGYYDGSLINDGRINSSNYGGSSDGILERGSGSVAVDNSGAISGLYNGIYLNSNGSVANETGGTISGSYLGVYIFGSFADVTNDGSITATDGKGVYLRASAGAGTVTNTGFIGGGDIGIAEAG